MKTTSISVLPATGHGFTLIEVLVALFVLSIGMLGVAALQMTSLQVNTGSYLRTQATFLAYDIIDRMRANSGAVIDAGRYDVSSSSALNSVLTAYAACKTSACKCGATSCTSDNLAVYDIGTWYDLTVATLPGAETAPPTIDINATRRATITIRWMERDLSWSKEWVVQL
jgi:type IV pilus assembly protein PilV